MKTEALINALAADAMTQPKPLARLAAMVLVPLTAVLTIAVLMTIGFRSGFQTSGVLAITSMKWAISVPLALAGIFLSLKLALPLQFRRFSLVLLAIPAGLLLAMIAWELNKLGVEGWQTRMTGRYGLECLVFVPLFSLLPLAAMIYILQQGAVMRPNLAALAASMAATGIGASVYELHCTDDSPLFMALWYVMGLLIMVGIGQALAARFLRW